MELMEGTVRAWGEALMMRNCIWDERLDAWRIREAFLRLSARAERWPAPTHLIDALPDRILPKLPEPEMSDEQRRANLRRISQIMTDALNQKKPPEGESR